jgi:hypothetical protein
MTLSVHRGVALAKFRVPTFGSGEKKIGVFWKIGFFFF